MRIHPLPLLAAGLLSGCVAYQPAPISIADSAQRRMAAALDHNQVAQSAQRIAPNAPLPASGYDRLMLFAALLDHDPKVVKARAAIATAEAEARSSRKAVGPIFTLTSEYANDPSTSSPWLLGGAMDIPLDIGGQRKARLDRADIAVIVARYDYVETIWSERMALRSALIDGEIARRQVALGKAIVAMRDRQIAALERQVTLGELPGAALSPYRALRAQEARGLDDANAKAATSLATIAGILGVPLSALNDDEIIWPAFDTLAPDPTQSITPAARIQATSGRADVLKSLAAYDQTEADVRLEIAKQYPSISLAPGYTWERGLVKLPLSINLALPNFDLNRSAIRASLARRDEAGAAVETAIAAAQAEIDAAIIERNAAMQAFTRLARVELPQTKASADRAEARLAQGQIARADWADAQLAYLTAQLGALDGLARVQTADTAIENALRRPIEGPELNIKPELLETAR